MIETFYEHALQKRLEQKHFTLLKPFFFQLDLNYQDFTSTDFLDLAKNSAVKDRIFSYVTKWGVGSTASRPLPDHLEATRSLERRFASLLDKESLILFQPHAKLLPAIMAALSSPRSLLLKQRSLFLPSGSTKGTLACYDKDPKPLFLAASDKKHDHTLLFAESLSLQDGSFASITELSKLAKEYRASLIIDDSASFGCFGPHGMGLSAGRKEVDIIIGHIGPSKEQPYFSYLASSRPIREYLFQSAPELSSFVPLSPLSLAVAESFISLLPHMELERKELLTRTHAFHKELLTLGWPLPPTASPIIALPFDHPVELKETQDKLLQQHYLASAILPPHVLPHASKLRLLINHSHTSATLKSLLSLLK